MAECASDLGLRFRGTVASRGSGKKGGYLEYRILGHSLTEIILLTICLCTELGIRNTASHRAL